MAQGQGALLGTYPGLANQFVTSHAAMRQMQETLVQEQNLFISLLGAVWRRVIIITINDEHDDDNMMMIRLNKNIHINTSNINSNTTHNNRNALLKRLSKQVKGQKTQEER